MEFKRKKISKSDTPQFTSHSNHQNNYSTKNKRRVNISLGAVLSGIIIIILIGGIVKAVSSIDFRIFLKAAGDELKTDIYNHTNFLILGTGDKTHEGSDLTDTILVASLDKEHKLITMISVPRDLYVKDSALGNSRINEVYFNAKNYFGNSTEALEKTKEKIEGILGIPIHYWLKIDFTGFTELIDAIGGIDVEVKENIVDPYYPGKVTYETFRLNAGPQHLDGATALKYARSRKTTSDFDRADRQQQIIYAIKQKALEREIIFSPEKISNILETIKKNMDTNITVKEILTLGAIASEYSSNQIAHRLIHDDPARCGGFLYTPAREFYGGAFVLLPAGGFEMLHDYTDLQLNSPEIAAENLRIQVLNGTRKGGVAGETKQILQRFCLNISRFGNGRSKEITTTTYYYKPKLDENGKPTSQKPQTLIFLQKLIPGKESTQIPQDYIEAGYDQAADIILEIGSDYTDSPNYIEDPFYSLPQLLPPTPTSTETSNESSPTETTNKAE